MEIWLKYLLGSSSSRGVAEDPVAQAVYILPSNLIGEKGLDHAGEPTGIGLGWIHILPLESPSHIIEKTGGGAGFETYIAINHARRIALFLAATDGAIDSHLNLFNAANKLLLAVAGLPPLPPKITPVVRTDRAHRHRNLGH
jgi:D-alanyl-D-alanine-carboxypeptidase/D-alanyl-D-alanine-endopeptidase